MPLSREKLEAVRNAYRPADYQRRQRACGALAAACGVGFFMCMVAFSGSGDEAIFPLMLFEVGLVVGAVCAARAAEPVFVPQGRRVQAKCRELARTAARSSGLYRGMEPQFAALAADAKRVVDTLANMQRSVDKLCTEAALRGGAGPAWFHNAPSSDRALQTEVSERDRAAEFLEETLGHLTARQRVLATRLQRIEDLLDAASLEIAAELPLDSGLRQGRGIANEIADELQATRAALEEVEAASY